LIGVDRKWSAEVLNDAFDPEQNFPVPELVKVTIRSRRSLGPVSCRYWDVGKVPLGLELASVGVRFQPMKDEWNETLRCPVCGTTGMASLCQVDGAETPAVQNVPRGFKVVHTEYGPNFSCETCDVAVQP
jgi:hypothetical protein